MTTPSEKALGMIAPLADTSSRRAALSELIGTTTEIRNGLRVNSAEVTTNELLRHKLSSPILQTKLTDRDFLAKLGGDALVQDMKELPTTVRTIGFPGFEVSNWPATVGQLYATTLTTMGDGLLPFVYGFDDTGLGRIERSLVPLFEQSLTNPQFQEDTVAIQEFLALLQARRIPPLVVVGGLGKVTGGDLSQIPIGELPTLVRSGMKNTASDMRANSITLSEHERNEAYLQTWIGALQKLHSDLQ